MFYNKQVWESERDKIVEKMKNLEGEQEDSRTRLQEFDVSSL